MQFSMLPFLAAAVSLLPPFVRSPLCQSGMLVDLTCNNGALFAAALEGPTRIQSVLHEGLSRVDARDSDGLTPVHIACLLGEASSLSILAQHGARLDTQTLSGQTCVSIAAEVGHLDLLSALLSAKLPINVRSLDGSHALLRAIRRRQWVAAEMLLSAGSDPGITLNPTAQNSRLFPDQEPVQQSALRHLLVPATALQFLARDLDAPPRLASMLLHVDRQRRNGGKSKTGENVVDAVNIHGVTAVGMASALGNTAVLGVLLTERPNLEKCGESGYRALSLAAWEGKAEAVGMLLQSGADPASVASDSGQTALHLAAAQGHVAVIEAVLANVASALHESLLELRNAGGASPLSVACSRRRHAAMSVLLRAGARVDSADRAGITCAIAWAATPSSLQVFSPEFSHRVVSELMAAGANLNAHTTAGLCAVVAAVKNDQESFAVALLEAGASWDVNDVRDVAGATLSKLASDAHMDILLNAMRRARKA